MTAMWRRPRGLGGSMASTSGKAAHSSFASSAAAKQATAAHGRPVIQHSSAAKHSSAASTMLRPQT